MKISDNGIKFICEHEGFSNIPYVDPISGGEPITIGYGTTIYPNGKKVKLSDCKISELEAVVYIKHDLLKIEEYLSHLNLNQNQFDSLCSFAYNLGLGRLKESTLLKRIISGEGNLREAFLMWNRASGHIVDGLTKRRNEEADLFLSLTKEVNRKVNLYISTLGEEKEFIQKYNDYINGKLRFNNLPEPIKKIIQNG